MEKDNKKNNTTQANGQLGVMALAAVVVSSMIGGGIYSLPQNMAADASVGAVLISWIITGFGIYFIANTFRILSAAKPDCAYYDQDQYFYVQPRRVWSLCRIYNRLVLLVMSNLRQRRLRRNNNGRIKLLFSAIFCRRQQFSVDYRRFYTNLGI